MRFDFSLILESLTDSGAAIIGGLLIFGLLVCFFAVFWWRTGRIISGLRLALESIRKFSTGSVLAENFSSFSSEIESNSLMRAIWLEYKETILPQSASDRPLRNIHDSHFFFNDSAILAEKINVGFWRAAPNYLTGFGIFGTFLGLVAGIYMAQSGLTAGDTKVVNEALSRLLEGASLAFSTSLAGLGSSIVLSWWVHQRFFQVHSLLSEWNGQLDDRMERVSLEHLSVESLRQAKEQTEQLKRFNTDLAVSIAEALDQRVSERLTPALDRMIGAMEAMRESQQEMGRDTVLGVVQQFQNSLTGNTDTALQGLSSTLTSINESLEKTMNGLSHGQDEMARSMRALAGEIEASIRAGSAQMNEEMNSSLKNLADVLSQASELSARTLTDSGSQVASEVTESVRALHEAVSRMTSDLVGRNAEVQEGAAAVAERLREEVTNSLNSFREVLSQASEQSAKTLTDSGSQVSEEVKSSVTQMRDALSSMAREMTERNTEVQESAAAVSNRLREDMDTASERLRNQFKQAGTHVTEASAQAATQISEALNGLHSSVSQFASSISELKDYGKVSKNVVSEMQNLITQFVTAAESIENAASPLSLSAGATISAAEELENATRGVQAVVVKLGEQATLVGEYTEETRQLWLQYRTHFADLEQALGGVFQELQSGLASYSNQVGGFHTNLDDHLGKALGTLGGAVEELSEAIENLDGQLGRDT